MDPAEVTAFIGLGLVMLTHGVIIARWSARMATVQEQHGEEMKAIRKIVEGHHSQLYDLEVSVEVERQVLDRLATLGVINAREKAS